MEDCCVVFLESERKARKEHKCCECRGIIQPKELYTYSHGVHDGRGFGHKTCAECTRLRSEINATLSGEDQCYIGELYEHIFNGHPALESRFLEIKRKRKAKIPEWMLARVNEQN